MDVTAPRTDPPLALSCVECRDSVVLPFVVVGDRDVLVGTLAGLGWMLSVATVKPRDGVETLALTPLCDLCARRIHGDPLVNAAHQLIAGRRS